MTEAEYLISLLYRQSLPTSHCLGIKSQQLWPALSYLLLPAPNTVAPSQKLKHPAFPASRLLCLLFPLPGVLALALSVVGCSRPSGLDQISPPSFSGVFTHWISAWLNPCLPSTVTTLLKCVCDCSLPLHHGVSSVGQGPGLHHLCCLQAHTGH